MLISKIDEANEDLNKSIDIENNIVKSNTEMEEDKEFEIQSSNQSQKDIADLKNFKIDEILSVH